MQYFIGCSGFYNRDWKKVFYPETIKQKEWFEYYCTRFHTLELNTTFYRFPTIEMLKKWYDKSPADFRFSVKIPRLITHYKQLIDTEKLLSDFYTAVSAGLKEKLAAVLFQLPSKIMYSEEVLQRIIKNVNSSFINVFEFRHASWWNENVFTQFSKYNISFCGISIKDLSNKIIANTSTIYYRFHGIEKIYFSEYDPDEIKKFATVLKTTAENKTAYIYFNNTATIAAIHNAEQLKKILCC
jgi:uncharacterized protein YecE (DUF72 family)